jgi:Glycosyltransferase family 87
MKAFNLPWVIRKFIDLAPRLIVATVIILWVYFSFIYFKDWGYRILSGVKLNGNIPVGGDFSHYWIGARLALTEGAPVVYDPARLQAALAAFFGVNVRLAWFYPPTFLLMVLPLGYLPYLTSLAVWLLTTLGAYLWVIRRIAPHPITILATLIFSATIQNFGFGQNGFLSTALLGGGLLLMDRYPFAGGALLGLLTYKPHLAVLVPVALLAGRHWKTLLAMLVTAMGLVFASVLVLGYQVWLVFLTKNIPGVLKSIQTGKIMDGASLPWDKMPTFFSALNSTGIGLLPAVILQGIIMLGIAALVFRVWRQDASLAVRGSFLVLGTFLFTPYLFTYDLCLLALPLAWLAWDGYTRGWAPGEKWLLFLCWIMPMFSEYIAKVTILPIPSMFFILLMVIAARRQKFAAKDRRLGNWKFSWFREASQ